MIRYTCQSCHTAMTAPDKLVAQKGACPKCGQRVQAPMPPVPMLAPAPVAEVLVELVAEPDFVEPLPDWTPHRQERDDDRRPRANPWMLNSGLCLLILGGVGLVYFFLMDTTVESRGFGGRVTTSA